MSNKTLTFEEIPSYLLELGKKLENIEELLKQINTPKQIEVECPIDINEASKFINKQVPTIYTLCQKKQIPYSRQGKRLYFFKTQLSDWILKGGNSPYQKTKH